MNVGKTHSQDACAELLGRFFVDPGELLAALAPEGWERSPIAKIFHATVEQLEAERTAMRRNLASLLARPEREGELPEEVEQKTSAAPVEPEREVVELVGGALWDIFSNNHTVIDRQGSAYDLGSFRASAAVIAETINRRYPLRQAAYDYLDFYMGTALRGGRADLRPVYRWIFGRLREANCDWIYAFPRLYLLDLGTREEQEDGLDYDPSRAVRAELDRADREREAQALAEELERAYREAIAEARRRPLPAVVAAYRDVFGALPAGWPHPDM